MKIKGWHSEVALADIKGYVTVTRYQDPANNSNKYRRFITLAAQGEKHLLIHHTGRWTHLTARNLWSGGVYRVQGVAKDATQRNYSDVMVFNREMVRRKLGGYNVTEERWLTGSEIKQILDLSKIWGSGSTAPANNPPTQSAPAQSWIDCPDCAYRAHDHADLNQHKLANHSVTVKTGQWPQPATVVPQQALSTAVPAADPNAKLADQVSTLLARASSNAVNAFDLWAELAVLKSRVKAEVDRVRLMEEQVSLITETILLKENA